MLPEKLHFSPLSRRLVEASFTGGHITSDAGLLLLREVDRQHGLTRRLAKIVPDQRDPGRVQYGLQTLLAQRIYALAAGYEDLKDHDGLRHDYALQTAVRSLNAEEEAYWREDLDNVQAIRDSTNVLLQEARKLSSEIESLNDIDAYLVEHEEADAHLVQALQTSRYLGLWHDEFERNSWQYHVALMEGHNASEERKRKYCEELLADQKIGQNRFVLNHAAYVTLNTAHPRQYFARKVELYDLLASCHARRIKAATTWLERRGLLEPVSRTLLRPHSSEWFASLREWNPKQAAMTEAAIQVAVTSDVCSICADDPACDYAFVSTPAAGPGTLRLCDDCFRIQSIDKPMEPF